MSRALSIATAAFFAFITAVIFVILFVLELLPSTVILAISGIVISAAVIGLMFLVLGWCTGSSCRNNFNNALGCFGRPVVFAAVISLDLSLILAAANPTSVTTVYTGIVFAQIFLLIFTVFMLAFLIALALPAGCSINGSSNGNCSCNCSCNCCCCYNDD